VTQEQPVEVADDAENVFSRINCGIDISASAWRQVAKRDGLDTVD
jgi:hypothetical protein